MGIYKRKDSKYYWMSFDKDPDTGKPPLPAMSTKIEHAGADRDSNAALKKEALLVYFKKLAEIHKGIHIVESKKPRTFREHAEWWIEDDVKVNHKSPDTTISSVNILIAEFGNVQLADFTPGLVVRFIAKRKKGEALTDGRVFKAVGDRTINRDMDNLYVILKTAVREKYIDVHPLMDPHTHKRMFERKRGSDFKAEVLTRDQWDRIVKAIDAAPDIMGTPRIEGLALIYAALQSLLRRDSLLRLTWGAYKEGHFVPLDAKVFIDWAPVTADMAFYLDQLVRTEPSAFIFKSHYVSGSKKAAKNHLKRWFQEVCARANVPYGRKNGGVTFHCLRHTGATWAIRAGVDPRTVMSLGGWKNPTVFFNTYCHTDHDRMRAAAEMLLGKKVRSIKKAS